MKLSEYFSSGKLLRDADIKLTHFANQHVEDKIVCFALSEGYIYQANLNPDVSAVITSEDLYHLVDGSKGLVVSETPKKDYYGIHNFMFEQGEMSIVKETFIHPSAKIASTAIIEDNVVIGENVVIDHFTIIKSQTVIESGSRIGAHCVIGARGMNNTKVDGTFMYVHDAGGVHIGKNCEVLDAAIIQKSIHKEMTSIGDETKISIKVNIAHGTIIGKRTLVAGSAQIAGYVTIGDDVWVGPSATIAHNLAIGDKAEIKIGSVVVKNIKSNEVVSGNFAYAHNIHIKNFIRGQK